MIATLTPNPSASILSIPCHRKGGIRTPFFRLGAKTPLSFVVFLFLYTSHALIFADLIRIKSMARKFIGDALRITAPNRGSSNPANNLAAQRLEPASGVIQRLGKRHMTNTTNDAHNAPTQTAHDIAEDNYILGLISSMSPIFKGIFFSSMLIKYGNLKPANDAVFSFQRYAPIQHKSITACDKLDVLLMQIDDAYKRIENTENGLLCNLNPERYRALKARLSGIIEQ